VRRGDAGAAGALDLVGHERDQRADAQGQARQEQRRDLIADALSAARRENAERIFARQHRADEIFLAGPEGRIAEMLAESCDGIHPVTLRVGSGRRDGCVRRPECWSD
jgi:hypothetical protein